MKLAYSVAIILILLCSVGTGHGNGTGGIGSYPLPVVETEALLTRWLQQDKYTVASYAHANGEIELHGAAPGKTIRMLLRPHSPLATQIEQLEPICLDDVAVAKASWELYLAKAGKPESVTAIPERIRSLADAVVCINSPTADDKKLNFTGFLIDKKGTVVTIAHEFDRRDNIKLNFSRGEVAEGAVLKRDSAKDLSVIRSGHSGKRSFFSLKEGRSALNFGERIFMLCCDGSGSVQIQAGIVDKPKAIVNSQSLLQVTLEDVFFGSSGSPVVDESGRLVGVVKGRFRGTGSRGFLIPLDTVLFFVGAESK